MAPRIPRIPRKLVAPIATGVVVAVVAGLAIAVPGFDAQRTPVDDGAVWAIQSGENLRYGRVNVELGELDTVKRVENPAAVVQGSAGAIVLTSNYTRYARVSAARPVDLQDDSPELGDAPSGTRSVISAGEYVAFHTASGEVHLTRVDATGDPSRIQLPVEGDEPPSPWSADALALTPDGRVAGWSAEQRQLRIYDIPTASFVTARVLDEAVAPGTDAQVTLVGDRWVLFDPAEGAVLFDGRENDPIPVAAGAGAVLQRASLTGEEALLSDVDGLHSVPFGGGPVETVIDRTGVGVPAAVTELDGVRWAAWLGEGAAGGLLWRSDTREQRELEYGALDLDAEPSPVFQTTGTRMILNDIVSGWVWTMPGGVLVPSSQEWTAGEQEEKPADTDEVVTSPVDPKPPVVVDDSFGVRAGSAVSLPVLLNDSDPNGDVLTVVPSSLEGLSASFGSLTSAASDQLVVVQVAPGASGSATFSYRVEDGTADGGLVSANAATVTLTVIPEEQNSPPVWCGVLDCTAERPAPQLAPGGSVEFDWLEGWVDPDGDPIFVSRVEVGSEAQGVAVAAASDAASVIVRHTDPNAGGGRIPLRITVSDVRGAETTEDFEVPVLASPTILADSFAVVAQLGAPIEVDLRPHMSGGSGPLTVLSAIPAREGRGQVSLNSTAGTFTFMPPAAGSFVVDWTVSDGVREQSASVRITVREAVDERLSVAPVVAFVRPHEDATLDVFTAVSNPAGHVLLLSEASGVAAPGASLFVSTAGRDLLRVSGTTTDLRPGRIGEVGFTVSDGTGRPAATARGSVTVYLLPVPPAVAPIAVDDSVTVRVGGRVDVPVLANDVAVQGNAIAFDPRGTRADSGLAFTTSRTLRILAPDEPGNYAVRYTIYSVGSPLLTDVGTVHVTVLPVGFNTPPTPGTLLGRVVSGGVVSIPFPSLGADPDGDEVVLESITSQPERGAARLSADGRAMVYTSVLGHSGEVSFEYRVRDSEGATGVGTVRVGVLDANEDPSPIAYSDYVQVTAGADSKVVVRPLDNDIDPARTTLSLIGDPVPNVSRAEGFEQEYQSALDRVESVVEGTVTFRAGTELGTFSYFYDVANEYGDISRGTIVLRVVRETVASTPIVADTVLTAETRGSFAQGVNVVAGRVSWPGGDVGGLSLRLWRDEPGVSVQGTMIRGALPDERRVIPFELSGLDFQGQEVVAYGFLVVPGPLDLPPMLRAGTPTPDVKEREALTVDLSSIVVQPAGASIEIDAAGVHASGQRSTASCAAEGDLSVHYIAGENSPWRDYCIVPLRYIGQDYWTHLTVPVRVVPGDPQPELRAASLEISPGDELVYDLGSMTTWQGDPQSDAVYELRGSASSFEILADSSTQTLTIRGLDDSVPGTVEVVPVTITNPRYAGVLPAGLTLKVGPAPSTLPKGGTATQECSISRDGTQCVIRVVGATGEVNPLPRTPLVVASVGDPESCPSVDFAVQGTDSIRASWTPETPGAVCTASFTVLDAQSRESASDRVGTVILDFQGLPGAAASVEQAAYGNGMVRLTVTPGGASAAYPELTGFEIVYGGQVVGSCRPQGDCDPITGLPNGDQDAREYQAFAVNDQGRALTAPTVRAWAYAAPPAPTSASFAPSAPTGDRAAWTGGLVDLTVEGVSADTARLEVRRADGSLLTTHDAVPGTVVIERVNIGVNTPTTVRLTPISTSEVPDGSTPAGAERTVSGVHGVGRPEFTADGFTATPVAPGGQMQLVAPATIEPAPGVSLEWRFQKLDGAGSPPSCAPAPPSAWTSSDTGVLEVAEADRNDVVNYGVCVRARFGSQTFGVATLTTTGFYFHAPDRPAVSTGYSVSTANPSSQLSPLRWTTLTGPDVADAPTHFTIVYIRNSDGETAPSFAQLVAENVTPDISVRYCLTARPYDGANPAATCSDPSAIPHSGGLSLPVKISYTAPACPEEEDDDMPTLTITEFPVTVDVTNPAALDDDNMLIYLLEFAAGADVSFTLSFDCTPPAEPEDP